MKFSVYETTNTKNGKIYVGVHKTNNPNDEYLGSGKYLQDAICKDGKDNFTKMVLSIFETSEEAYAEESRIVDEEFVKRKDTYNIKLGGLGGWDHFTEFQSRNEAIAKVRDYTSDEYRAKRSDIAKRSNKNRNSFFGNARGFTKGSRHSEKAKVKISKANKGRTSSTKGRMWVHNIKLKKAKMILPGELEEFISSGWIVGNKRNFEIGDEIVSTDMDDEK